MGGPVAGGRLFDRPCTGRERIPSGDAGSISSAKTEKRQTKRNRVSRVIRVVLLGNVHEAHQHQYLGEGAGLPGHSYW